MADLAATVLFAQISGYCKGFFQQLNISKRVQVMDIYFCFFGRMSRTIGGHKN